MEGKIIDFDRIALKEKVEQWASHPDVQIGCSFFITALMTQGFSKFVLDQVITDAKGKDEEEKIKGCIFEGAQRYMQGTAGQKRAFSPVQLKSNLYSCIRYIDKFLSMRGVQDEDALALDGLAANIKSKLEAKGIKLIAVSGKRGSGKDETYEALFNKYGNVAVLKFADALKEATCTLLGCRRYELETEEFKNEKDPTLGITYREFMQKFGTEAMRTTFGPLVWVRLMIPQLENLVENMVGEGGYIVLTDVRFDSEIDFAKKCGATTVRINRPGLPTAADSHASETELDNYPFDMVLTNDGSLEQFHECVVQNVK